MDPITILGISLATIIAGESLIVKVYSLIQARRARSQQEFASLPVSDTT